ncbi:alanyl-tRNA editing protein [Salinispira pacifica]
MTEKLFYGDQYTTEFDANVVRVEEADGALSIILDRTFFYPEGGGQPADSGSIGDAAVVDVQKRGGEILHIVRKGSQRIRAGAVVHARVDWHRRHEYMQQHTGQHIISAALLLVGEHNTVSVHQGEEYTTIEVDSEQVPSADVEAVEELANRIIREHRRVTDEWVSEEEIGSYPLRRPPKVSGRIRLVMIDDFDCVACGGVHARDTSEVGLVKCIGTERIRGRVRTVWKIGERAYADYALKHDVVAALVQEFSAPPAELVPRIRQQLSQLSDARKAAADLRLRLAEETADRLYREAAATAGSGHGALRVVTHRMEGADKELFRAVAESLAGRESCLFCLANVSDGQLQWAVGTGRGSTEHLDFDRVKRELLPHIEGKGGGRPPIWQGAGRDPAGLPDLFEGFRSLAG